MAGSDLASAADALRRLHHADRPLVLPNAWDVASARVVVDAGCPAVATSSGAVAKSLGFDDGDVAPVDEMLAVVARIAAAVDVPVTADMEAGYSLPANELVDRLLQAGAVGLNLEDTDHHGDGVLIDAGRNADWLAAVKEAGRAAGVDVVLNARVDVHLRQVGPPEARLDEALARGRRYLDAGADCVYPIAVDDEATIATFVNELRAPVNVMARPSAPPLPRLTELGVARVSAAGGVARLALNHVRRAAEGMLAGDLEPLFRQA